MATKYENNDTLTGICNSALAMAGHTDFIKDIDQENTVAETCKILIRQVVRDILSHEYVAWDELYAVADLVRKDKKKDISRRVQWNKPLNMIASVACYKKGSGARIPFEEEGGYIVCDERKDVCLKYVRFSMNPGEWSSELRTLVVKLLCARIVSAIVKNIDGGRTLELEFWQTYYPFIVGSKKNKNTQNNYLGNDGIVTQNYIVRGQGFIDTY